MTPNRQGTVISLAGQTFSGIELPNPLPIPTPVGRMKEWFMSDGGEDDPGLRVQEPLGAHVSYSDFEFTLGALSRAKIDALSTAFYNQATAKAFSITPPDEPSMLYTVLFAPDGFQPALRRGCGYDDPLRYSARIRLRILTRES